MILFFLGLLATFASATPPKYTRIGGIIPPLSDLSSTFSNSNLFMGWLQMGVSTVLGRFPQAKIYTILASEPNDNVIMQRPSLLNGLTNITIYYYLEKQQFSLSNIVARPNKWQAKSKPSELNIFEDTRYRFLGISGLASLATNMLGNVAISAEQAALALAVRGTRQLPLKMRLGLSGMSYDAAPAKWYYTFWYSVEHGEIIALSVDAATGEPITMSEVPEDDDDDDDDDDDNDHPIGSEDDLEDHVFGSEPKSHLNNSFNEWGLDD